MNILEDPNLKVIKGYKATNVVRLVESEGRQYVTKKPRLFGDLIYFYYYLQDQRTFGTRLNTSNIKGLEVEAGKLKRLKDVDAVPDYVSFDGRNLVREYVEGVDWRNLTNDEDRERCLEGAIKVIEKIHKEGVVVGASHIKNVVLGDKTYWVDFDGAFDESDMIRGQAIDLARVIYSTYQKGDDRMAEYAAHLISKNYPIIPVKEVLKGIFNEDGSGLGHWFAHRVPQRVQSKLGSIL